MAEHFVTVSECSRRDLIDIVGIAPERITNTYQSVDIPAKYRDKPVEQVAREVEGATNAGYKDYFSVLGLDRTQEEYWPDDRGVSGQQG